PLTIVALRRRAWLGAGICMVGMMLANAFGTTMLVLTLCSFFLAYGVEDLPKIAITSVLAYLVACPFLPSSLFGTIAHNHAYHGALNWGPGSYMAIALVLCGYSMLWLI